MEIRAVALGIIQKHDSCVFGGAGFIMLVSYHRGINQLIICRRRWRRARKEKLSNLKPARFAWQVARLARLQEKQPVPTTEHYSHTSWEARAARQKHPTKVNKTVRRDGELRFLLFVGLRGAYVYV